MAILRFILNLTFRSLEPAPGHDLAIEEVAKCLACHIEIKFKHIQELAFALLHTCSRKFSKTDETVLLRNAFFMIQMLLGFKAIVDGESYGLIDNGRIQFTRAWSEQILGTEFTDYMFEFAERIQVTQVTDREIALIIPCVLTLSTPGMCYILLLKSIFSKNRPKWKQ
jgi:hypothetical protein